jgi:hypothetical protein
MLFTAAPPEPTITWPSSLPRSTVLRVLFDLMDGGFVGGVHLFSREELVVENEWVRVLPGVSRAEHTLEVKHPDAAGRGRSGGEGRQRAGQA